MAQAVVVELSQTSAQKRRMGEESLLSRHRRTNVEICGTHQHPDCSGTAFMEETALCGKHPVQRHRKIKGEANPFDPQWRSYFAQRGKGSTVRQTIADDRLST